MKVPAQNGAMFRDLASERIASSDTTDVCIVGTGPAGLTLARALAEKGVNVLMLEKGPTGVGSAVPEEAVAFDRRTYSGATAGRSLGWGGTSALWGGQLLPLHPGDIGPRKQHGIPAWPIEPAELDSQRSRLEHWLGVVNGPFDELHDGRRHPVMGLDMASFSPRFSKWITFGHRHLGHSWEKDLAALGVRVWTQAEAFQFRTTVDPGCADGARRVTEVLARSPLGNQLVVRASRVVFAAGALDSAALALQLVEQGGLGPANGSAFLGKYLHDHLSLRLARVRVSDPGGFNKLFAPVFEGKTMRTLRLELRSSFEPSSVSLPPLYAHVVGVVRANSGVAVLRDLLRAVQQRNLARASRLLLRVPMGLPAIAQLAFWRLVRRRLVLPSGSDTYVHIDFEQPPLASNRVRLMSAEPFGQLPRKVCVDWDLGVDVRPIVEQAGLALQEFWKRNDLDRIGTLELTSPEDVVATWPANLYDIFHPAGTTRMGHNGDQGAVSPHLRLFGSTNVFILSSSVFPSLGSANPTLTLMLLAMRLSEHLRSQPAPASKASSPLGTGV